MRKIKIFKYKDRDDNDIKLEIDLELLRVKMYATTYNFNGEIISKNKVVGRWSTTTPKKLINILKNSIGYMPDDIKEEYENFIKSLEMIYMADLDEDELKATRRLNGVDILDEGKGDGVDMSEEEIINKINYMINNWHRSVVEINIKWIQGLLDLYNKEKEKNEIIMNENINDIYESALQKTMNKYIKTEIAKDFISKDKIKEILKNKKPHIAQEKLMNLLEEESNENSK